jgi:hypothetical protein
VLTRDERLTVEWVDPRGKVWNLTDGTEGVILDVGQSDFTLSPLEHHYVRGGTQWAGVTRERAEPSLKVVVGYDLKSSAYYQLADEWWSKANSADHPGTLRITRPDGVVRYLTARLRDTPGTTYQFDPGAGLDDPPGEPWLLTSPSAFYDGDMQLTRFTLDSLAVGTPFYGPDGTGWPLYIGEAFSAGNITAENNGEGPVWPVWTLTGPLSNAYLAVGDGRGLTFDGALGDGQSVRITTEPGARSVVDLTTGESLYSVVRGTYQPIPAGREIPMTITADGMTTSSAIEVRFSEKYVRPF